MAWDAIIKRLIKRIATNPIKRGSLAQLVEQRTFNPFVAGSNPARPTIQTSKTPSAKVLGVFVCGFVMRIMSGYGNQINYL